MKDKALYKLYDQFETDMISEMLREEGIPFRIELASENWLGVLMGEGANIIVPYARLWGYVQDKDRIGKLLEELRQAEIRENEEDD